MAGLMRRHYWNNKLIFAPPCALLRRLMDLPEIRRDYASAELVRINQHLQRVGELFYAKIRRLVVYTCMISRGAAEELVALRALRQHTISVASDLGFL
jgi:hypothetical protein